MERENEPRRVLQHLYLLERLLVLRLGDNVGPSDNSHASGSVRGPQMIGGSDRVLAGIVNGNVYYVERDESEIVVGPESGADRDRTSVLEPFNPHGRVAHRFQTALQVNILALADWLRIAQRLDEDRLRLGDLLDMVMRLDEFGFLQALSLLIGATVHTAGVYAGTR